MLVVETIARIRREFFVKGKSIKEIVRELKVSRNTVRKVLRSEATSFSYQRQVQPLPRLGRWRDDLDRLLVTNASKVARERLTLIRVFEELRALGYEGGYDAVRRYARPLAKDVEEFVFADTPVNETLVRDLAGGDFLAHQRNAVLIGGTGTGKTHLAIAIARSCIRAGARGRFYNVVDLVNRLEAETRSGRQGRLAEYLTGLPAICALRRPASVPSDQPALRADFDPRHHEPRLWRVAERVWRCQDDNRAAGPTNPSL
jgi:transcriptional regulator with XRE-family HTH domain